MERYNSTSQILPYANLDIKGVILPGSDKVLTPNDLDRKIQKAKSHLAHLTSQIPHRNTHGGKRFRSRKISLLNQISIATARLHLLEEAKEIKPSNGRKVAFQETTEESENFTCQTIEVSLDNRIKSTAFPMLAMAGETHRRGGFNWFY